MNEPLATLDHIASAVGERTPSTMELGELKPAAVAIPLLIRDDGIRIVLTVRTDTVEHHKNEISFPGGRVDAEDASELDAAKRETWEEIGIPPARLELLGRLDDFQSISGYRVRPFVMHLTGREPEYAPQPGEVSEIIEIPLTHLLDPANHTEDDRPRGYALQYFHWKGRTVWGLTGAILRQLLEVAFDFKKDKGNGDGRK